MEFISTVEKLREIYGSPSKTSIVKETRHITPHYRAYIEASPVCGFATVGPEGLDCSPRGDMPGFVRVHDENTLMMPDRRGNNRVDSLVNIVRDPRVAMMFLIPGHGNCLRVNGEARIAVDDDLRDSFGVNGKAPRSVIVIRTNAVYFQCARAILRSRIWDSASHVEPSSLPSPGEILAEVSNNDVGGQVYDDEWMGRAQKTLW
ncbi:MAG: pyridoxamine 5'-phosphate oxidase family protein [Pseudomonadota bacterium]